MRIPGSNSKETIDSAYTGDAARPQTGRNTERYVYIYIYRERESEISPVNDVLGSSPVKEDLL